MKIVHYPHPALRHKSKPITTIDKQLHLHIGGMMEAMYGAKGLGLAAPQVALPYQLLVMNITGDPAQPDREEVFLNPQIIERKGFIEDEEGCLSFPGLYQKIRRSKTIKVRAYNLKGELVEKIVGDIGEGGRVGEIVERNAMHPQSFLRDVAFGMHKGAVDAASRHMVFQFQARDLDDPVAIGRIEAGRFGIQNDFAHHCCSRRRCSSAITCFTCAKAWSRPLSVSITKSAFARFSASGTWRA